MPTLLSLFDLSGSWSQCYVDEGWTVIRVDVGYDESVLGTDWMIVRTEDNVTAIAVDMTNDFAVAQVKGILMSAGHIDGVLAAPDCSCFTRASAWLWIALDEDGRTVKALQMVDACLALVQFAKPRFWALENPPGRLWNKKGTGLRQDALGEPRMIFRQYEFGGYAPEDPAGRQHKAIYIWGDFNIPVRWQHPEGPVANERWKKEKTGTCGRTQTMGSRNKRERARTPMGFSRAFFEANR